MALEVKQSVCVLCGDFRITDTTGTYDPATNPTGYGNPNAAFGDTTPYTIELTPPAGSGAVFAKTNGVFTLDMLDNPPSPDADGFYEYTVTAEQLGYEKSPASGVWTLTVTLGTDTKKIQYLAYGDIKSRIRACVCCAGIKHIGMYTRLKGAIELFNCFKAQEAQEVIDQLYRDTAECCDCGC